MLKNSKTLEFTSDTGCESGCGLLPVFQVQIHGLCSTEFNQTISFDRPVKSVALEPDFHRSSHRQFVTGDDKLILNERGFFKSNSITVLHQGEGPVRNIKWKGNFIAWANNHVSRL